MYADLEFYQDVYLAGDVQAIPDNSFERRAREASAYIDRGTFGRLIDAEEIPIEVAYAACELAEAFFENAQANSLTAKRSESVGGYTVGYADQAKKQEEFEARLRAILVRWLDNVDNLLYRGI